MKIQLWIFMVLANSKILKFLNRGEVWALKWAKFIIVLFWIIDTFYWGNLVSPQATHTELKWEWNIAK